MNRKSEQGAVLIVSLIMLLVMTVIGLAGMEVTNLEEKMAGNMRDRNIAFQAAEATLNDAEDYLADVVLLPDFDGSVAGLYESDADLWETVNWTSSSAVKAYSGEGFTALAETPAYVIEKLEFVSKTDDSLGMGGAVDTDSYYRVSARAVGQTDTAEVILQTVYKR
nr:PilX N-terminal domain-containing pilus assembly protein [uncultured Amphritea sp.]